MIYNLTEYSKKFKIGKKFVSPRTVLRRCKIGFLPSNHKARKLPGKCGSWIIEVPDIIQEPIAEAKPNKPVLKSMSSGHVNW